MIAVLLNHGQHLLYIPGRAVNHACGGYRGDGGTDAMDAAITADQSRVRRDLMPLRPGDELVTKLKVLTGRRRDPSDDRTRAINRLHGHLTGIFPGLERELDLADIGPLVLLTGYQTPTTIRGAGLKRLAPGCATARSAAPTSSAPQPSRPPGTGTPLSPARRSPPRSCTRSPRR